MAVMGGCGLKVRKLLIKAKTQVPQLQGISIGKITIVTVMLFMIFISRSMADFVCFFYDDCHLTIGDFRISLPNFGTTFNNWLEDLITCILFIIWEIIPAIAVLLLFWRIPATSKLPLKPRSMSYPYYSSINDSPSSTTRYSVDNLLSQSANVFKNPQRYDSDEETSSSLLPDSQKEVSPTYGSFAYTPYSTSSSLHDST